MEQKISYLERNFSDYRKSLEELAKKYYPSIANNFNDASVGAWLMDMNADIADNLSYYIDRVYQETNINSASLKGSLYSLARNNGVKIPGPKGGMAECAFTCKIPMTSPATGNTASQDRYPYWDYAPVIRKGTKVAAGTQVYELMEDLDFKEQFSKDGQSNRTIKRIVNSNGITTGYEITKRGIVIAGETLVYSKPIYNKDIVPFMEILIPVKNIMSIESILVKEGTQYLNNPSINEFLREKECWNANSENPDKIDTWRYYEVDSLADQYRWGPKIGTTPEEPIIGTYGYFDETTSINVPTYVVTKGEWKPLKQKFTTEYTDKGYLKVIFGSGTQSGIDNIPLTNADNFAKYQMSKIINNQSLGVLPNANTTVFILYRAGGGVASNVATGAINNIIKLKAEVQCMNDIDPAVIGAVKASITVRNTTPAVSGKDMPGNEEMRNLIKYNSGAQNRCVTLKDYINRVLMMPAKYGTPFRISGAEENNKVMLYLLGINHLKQLDANLPDMLVNNIQEYLSEYRSINDFVEIKSGKIINLSFAVDLYVDENYNSSDVITNVINKIKDYMDINKHEMGEDIFIGDLKKEISKLDGVINLIDVRVCNEIGEGYSQTEISQSIKTYNDCLNDEEKARFEANTDFRKEIDLKASYDTLYGEGDAMFEVKYIKDIQVRAIVR